MVVGFEQSHGVGLAEVFEPAFDEPRGVRMENAEAIGERQVGRHHPLDSVRVRHLGRLRVFRRCATENGVHKGSG